MHTQPQPSELMERHFPHPPTAGQKRFFALMDAFVQSRAPRETFLLKGFAGTGKTSLINVLVRVLRYFDQKSLLMSPTGRAAKVMSLYGGRKAFTIHKIIFRQVEDPITGRIRFRRQENKQKDTVYIVDEASMINDQSGEFGRGGLLFELVNFIFEQPESGNKLLLIGDTAQLPPVGQALSPALNVAVLEKDFKLKVTAHLMTDVVRQKKASGILENATAIRQTITQKKFALQLQTKGRADIFRMGTDKLEDGLRYAYSKFSDRNTVIVTRSNRSATQFNQFVRRQIRFCEAEIEAGDLIMVVRNNYFWLDSNTAAGFLANGEFAEVQKVGNEEELYGLRFADLTLQLIDYPNEPAFVAKVHLDTLHSTEPQLNADMGKKLFNDMRLDYAQIEPDERKLHKMLRDDPYLNALQIKFAYALTCHKAQGGQWDAVFVDLGYLTDEMLNVETMRWVYTALTRSTQELYLMNFPDQFFHK